MVEPAKKPAVPVAPNSEVEKLKKEVGELRTRVSDLESKHADDLAKLSKKLEALQKVVDAAEERREAEEEAAERKRANSAQVQNTLNVALTQLTTGNTSNLEGWLRSAEPLASPDAAKLISIARTALGQSDLVAARQALVFALAASQ